MVTQESLIEFFVGYAYEPVLVYAAVIALLTASSFGLPIPEEVTLISAGIVGYLALHPEKFPPPPDGGSPVNPILLSIVCFVAVFGSDLLVFYLGKWGGKRIEKSRRLKKYVTSEAMKKVTVWTEKYGAIMAGVFRFTPGIRFPGHMACGMLGVPVWKFILVDGTAALLTVPTQVLLVAYYGEEILTYFKQFKIVILSIVAVTLLLFFLRKTKLIQGLLRRA